MAEKFLCSCILFLLICFKGSCYLDTKPSSEGVWTKNWDMASCRADEGPCFKLQRDRGLTRLDGVKVGHERVIDLGQIGKRTMSTRAMKPLLFEIPNFLTDEECDHIIEVAKETGMFKSIARGGLTKVDTWTFKSNLTGRAEGPRGVYENWDFNQDGKITIEELKRFARIQRYLYLDNDEVTEMFNFLNMTEMDDGVITYEEFQSMNSILLDSYLYELTRYHPKHRERFSEQAWISQKSGDKILEGIQDRVLRLTELPRKVIDGSEFIQVVHYTVSGHYNAHYDSETHERPEVECCHQSYHKNNHESPIGQTLCKICRYITILFYLNNVEEGGATAFPVADNTTFDRKVVEDARKNNETDLYNLSEFCHKSNLVLSPRKGTTVFWYNHHLDNDNMWMGDRDLYSIHGGCAIKRGVKWIANFWIPAPYKHSAHIPSVYLVDPEEEESEEET